MNTKQPTMAIYGGNFKPPGLHHRTIAEHLTKAFDFTCVVPCGSRKDKATIASIPALQQKQLVELNFADLQLTFDHFDLFADHFTPTYNLDKRFRAIYPDREIIHVIGVDLVSGGSTGTSEIQTKWFRGHEVWDKLQFAVVVPDNAPFDMADAPPNSRIIPISTLYGRSTVIRQLLAAHSLEAAHYLMPEVYEYILGNQLFGTSAGKGVHA